MAGNILTRTAKRMGVPLWGQLLIGALVFIFVALAWQVFYRLGKVESAVKALATQSPMHDLVKELLSQAKGAPGNTELAQKAVTLTETIIRSASKMKAPAPLGFFDETIKDLDSLRETNTEIPRLKVMLAEYRSSLNEATASSENKTVTVKPFAQQILVFRGTVLRWGGQQGIDMFSRPVPCFNLSISQMGLASGQ